MRLAQVIAARGFDDAYALNGKHIQEGAVNRVSALVRAFDPCLSCSTHTLGMAAVRLELRGPNGELLDEAGTV